MSTELVSSLKTISDPKEREVFTALSDPRWDFRTIPGISKTTGIAEDDVRLILQKYPKLVRMSAVPDSQGRQLFTLRSRQTSLQERLALFRLFVTKSSR